MMRAVKVNKSAGLRLVPAHLTIILPSVGWQRVLLGITIMTYLSSPPPLSVCQSIGWFCWRFLPVIAQLFFGEFTLTCLLEGQTLTIKRCYINQTELKQPGPPILTQVNLWTASGNRHHLRSENTVQILQVGEDFYSIDTSCSLLSKFTRKLNKV